MVSMTDTTARPGADQRPTGSDLMGVWDLVRLDGVDGRRADASGVLIHLADSTFSLHLDWGERHIAAHGVFVFDGAQHIDHVVEGSTEAEWRGTVRSHRLRIERNRLHLVHLPTHPTAGHSLDWRAATWER